MGDLLNEKFCYCEVSGSHGSEYEGGCLQSFFLVQSGISLPKFQRCLLSPSS
jgi:hypothetical protein